MLKHSQEQVALTGIPILKMHPAPEFRKEMALSTQGNTAANIFPVGKLLKNSPLHYHTVGPMNGPVGQIGITGKVYQVTRPGILNTYTTFWIAPNPFFTIRWKRWFCYGQGGFTSFTNGISCGTGITSISSFSTLAYHFPKLSFP